MRRPEFGDVIASADFLFVTPDGDRREVTLRVAKPYEVSSIEWACPSEIQGHEPRYSDAHGGSSLQALCLAIALVRSRVENFISKGGRVFGREDDLEWDPRHVMAVFGVPPYAA